MSDMSVITSIEALAQTTDLWFVDIWGVIHNGVQPYHRATAACETFRAKGGTVILVSNAPRPRDSVARQLDTIGVAQRAYDGIVSSGDVARHLIEAWVGKCVMHIGPERDLPLLAGLGSPAVGRADDAEVVVCTGLYDDETETPADYGAVLNELKARDVPMICANPDQKVERGGRLIYCAGAVASAYEALGGAVRYAGKPYRPIYEMALSFATELRGADVAKDRILAIGDGVATDIAGAAGFGIRPLFVASGVSVRTGEDIASAASRLFAATGPATPVAVMQELAW